MKIGIIADDLTGANATGVALHKEGFSVATIIHTEQGTNIVDLDAICIDTDTRYADDQTVQNRITAAMSLCKHANAQIISKRIDSTFRGNIGLEVDTVLQLSGENSIAAVVCSFPDSGRISAGGYLLVDGLPLQQTDVANDPIKPLTESFLPPLLEKQSTHNIGHISLHHVLAGYESLRSKYSELVANGYRVIVIDAVTKDHIELIADILVKEEQKTIIPVDPGPLTAAYAKAKLNQHMRPGKIIVTVGSLTNVTRRQLEYVAMRTKSSPVSVNANKLASFTSSWEDEVERATSMALKHIHQYDVLIITTRAQFEDIVDLEKIANEEKTTKDALAKRITDGLANITKRVIKESGYPVQGCFTSGGDVTASLCATTEASGIKLFDEVFPLVAYGELMDGILPHLPIVTKGGMIGNRRAIYDCVKFLRTKVQRPYVQETNSRWEK